MKDIALIFPGQGAQKTGMGKELFEQSSAARAIFERANTRLGFDLTDVIFNGPDEKLMSTAFCQPAIFTVSIAAFEAFRSSPKSSGVRVRYAAGLSLGEYGALCAAGVLAFEDALDLIRQRSSFMEEAAQAAPGKMAAVIGFDNDRLQAICREADCEVANYNAPDQTVITGHALKVGKAVEILTAEGCRKVIPLEVSGAFHSSLMRPAAEKFAAILKPEVFRITDIPVITNVNARPQTAVNEVLANLPKQICSSVQWVDTVRFIAAQGISDMVEIGPGRVLKGLVRKIDPAINVQNIQQFSDIDALVFAS